MRKPSGCLKRRAETSTLSDWLGKAQEKLHATSPEEPSSTLRVLIAHVLCEPSYFPLVHPDYLLKPEQEIRLNQLLDRLISGTPLPYLTGKQPFFGLDFSVNPQVLIPRPETEMLVAAALDFIRKRGAQVIAADVGTGSGCIAISLAKNQPGLKVLAGDISLDAVLAAKQNASTHLIGQAITLWVGDLLSAIHQQFDCICANLPYIPNSRLPVLEVSKHEPISALDGGEDGFSLIERLLEQSASRLKPGGGLFLEIDDTHAGRISQSAEVLFPLSSITIEKDYAGLNRLAIVRMP